MTKTSPKIVIVGGFGWRDVGDEAMPQAVIYNLRKEIPNLDIVMLSPNPEYTTAYHKERSIPDINVYLNKNKPLLISKLSSSKLGIFGKIIKRLFSERIILLLRCIYFLIVAKFYSYKINLPIDKNARFILNELSNADLLFNNGGGNINTLFSEELYKQTLMIFASSILKVPVILSGQTIGPITKKLDAFVIKKALNRADTITFRDKGISLQLVKEIGVFKPIMQDTADDAISLPYLQQKEVEKLVIENNGTKWLNLPANIIVIMNMNGFLEAMGGKNDNEFDKEINLLSKVADQLVEQNKAKILLVPTDFGGASDDRPFLAQIKNKMRHRKNALVIEKEYEAIKYKSLIGFGDIAIGARYHFIVFATSMGVPCIGIANGVYQKTKLKGVLDLYNLPYCFIPEDMDKVEFDKVWATVTDVIGKRDKISRHLQRVTPILQTRSFMTIQLALDLLYAR